MATEEQQNGVDLSERIGKIAEFVATAIDDQEVISQLDNLHPLLWQYLHRVVALGGNPNFPDRVIFKNQEKRTEPVLEIQPSEREDPDIHLECYRFEDGRRRVFDHAISFQGDPDQGSATLKMEGNIRDKHAFFEPVDGKVRDYMTLNFTKIPVANGNSQYQVRADYIPLPSPA